MYVHFNDVDEFLAELASRPPDGPLRYTLERRPTTPPLKNVFVLATYRRRDEIVQLRAFCGELWNHHPDDKKVEERAKQIYEMIQAAAEKNDLHLAAGVYSEEATL